jgi:ech hydrogenase subunit E
VAGRTIVPFGPQHPVLPEPIHLDLVLEDEKVVEAIPSLGFIHRGLERLAEKKDFMDMTYVAERICGICSAIHGQAFSEAIENVMAVKVPPRADYLRVFWAELSRVHSHLLWLGLFADAFGFENLFMSTWRLRERILDIAEETAGGRVIFGHCKPGGVRRDVSNDTLKRIVGELKEIEAGCRPITAMFDKDPSVRRRLEGVGMLSHDDAYALGAVGPTIRGSGHVVDARKLGYAAYEHLDWKIVTEKGGDCFARCKVRVGELYESFSLARQAAGKAPEGPVDVKISGFPRGEYYARLEQPRGEVVYYVKGNGTKFLERFRVRTPTFANVPALVKMIQGCQLADVPVIVLTIDPCISCAER